MRFFKQSNGIRNQGLGQVNYFAPPMPIKVVQGYATILYVVSWLLLVLCPLNCTAKGNRLQTINWLKNGWLWNLNGDEISTEISR